MDKIPDLINGEKVALITWFKRGSPPSINNVPHFSTEYIWSFKKKPGLKWRNLKTFYDIPVLSAGCVSTGERITKNGVSVHPTQKPISLIRGIVGIEPNSICDPFMGTGTTLMVAKELNCEVIGIEIEEKYCEIAAKRIEKAIKRDRASFHLERKQRKTLGM